MSLFCQAASSIGIENLGFFPGLIIFILLLAVTIWTIAHIQTTRNNRGLLLLASLIVLVIPISIFFTFISLLLLEPLDDPIASTYFPLNAAVKNTCYLDPKHEHCPSSLAELIAIEPQNFRSLLNGKSASYSFYSDTRYYTLIIRHDSIPGRGVIFDPLLRDYGFDDFVDLDFMCGYEPTPYLNPSPNSWQKYLKARQIVWP